MSESLTDTAGFLKSVTIFEPLSDAERETLAGYFQERRYTSEERIVSEGEQSDLFFVIREGYVNIRRGENVFISKLGPGDYFGEAALFNNTKRIANVDAAGDVRVLIINQQTFEKYLSAQSHAANRILLQMLRQLFFRLERTSFELQSLRAKEGMAQNAIDQLFS